MKPKLRFKEFTDDWEEKKLGEIAENFIGGGTPNTKVPEYWNGDIAWIQSSDIDKNSGKVNVEKHISDKALKNSAAKLIPSSSIAVVTRVGVGKVALLNHEYSTSQDFLSFVNVYGNPQYWFYEISKLMYKQSFYLQGTSIKGITKSEILNISTFCPSLPEQEKIGKFFSLLDQRIEKQERKVALLEEEKKGYMQQIFNQELRFKDEEGNNYPDWEEKKFLDSFSLIIDYRGKTPKKLGLDWGNGNIKALSALNVKKGYIDWNADVHMGSEDLYSAWMKKGDLKQDDILFTTEAPLGNTALIPDNKKYILSQRVIALRTNENCNPKFIFQCMNDFTFENQIQKRSTGTTAKGINQKGLSKIKIQLPSLPEQEKIANFLSLLDQRIEKEQEKLHLLKQEKKGLLQQMFV
ncbi:restriction endonuclease subunit S [Catellicoccus marimammalium]|uniref:Type I restriction-modification system, specificity subunit S n=1 Tax=Catellicoccus marimammalium M35/04/3 TaxID=1234409 RepID=K8Z7S6_9ENTE|nr:restriction endonuclease subunit S [Catellicoccus marimammalium]EKU26935.1 Type I restriction-modification system, specificity subunit S [Catellicoccus marimammalium M35/04/3]